MIQAFESLILYQDEHYFVVNKPYGIATLDHRHADQPSMLAEARRFWPDAQACHRIDKETSGLLVFAKHNEAYRNLAMQFESRSVHKAYHAVCGGVHAFHEKEVDLPIEVLRGGTARIDRHAGKPAWTIFNTLVVFRHATLVQCEPVTGRMHQIRIHLAALKAPILADSMYGGTFLYVSQLKRRFKLAKGEEERPLMNRVALHAYSIGFKNVDHQTPVQVVAPYPKDFKALLRQLELHDSE